MLMSLLNGSSLGRASATIRRRLIVLRMFYDYLAYVCEAQVSNPVVAQRHYVGQCPGHWPESGGAPKAVAQ